MQAYLKKHGDGPAAHRVKVEWLQNGQDLDIKFSVHKRTSRPWLSDPAFTHDWSKNWGLWNKDVVEAFLQLRETPDDLMSPYLEVQVSPLNQPFALIISEPRKIHAAPKSLDFVHEVQLDGRFWNVAMKVKLPIELKGNYLFGGFYCCLDQGPREYFALEPNPELHPDFHRPEFFFPLANHE